MKEIGVISMLTVADGNNVLDKPLGQLHSLRDQSTERLKEGLRRDLGAVCLSALNDPDVIELMLNPDGQVWIDRLGHGMSKLGYRMPVSQSMKFFTSIASMLGTVVNADSPILEGELPLDGSRFEGIISPIVAAPAFAIRKKAILAFTLEDYRDSGILSDMNDPINRKREKQVDFLKAVHGKSHYDIIKLAIELRKHILIVGSTGSGKTTLVNAALHGIACVSKEQRIVLIEDTGEIQCQAENMVQMRSNANVDMTRLLRATMRLRPDRIIVGEVRGGEALALLKAWNTGHPGGLATVHANDCEAGLIRLEQLIQEAVNVVNPMLIAEAVDLVIFIDQESSIEAGRKVRELMFVDGYDSINRRYQLTQI